MKSAAPASIMPVSGDRPAPARAPAWIAGENNRPIAGLFRSLPDVEEAVARPRQTEILAQSLTFVFAPEYATPLQFRHDLIDEIVEPARQIRKHDGEAIARLGRQPLFHFVGDGFRRADHGQAGITAEPLRQLPDGEIFARSHFDDAFLRA